jgi:putative NIF3 family GTP cyclohydrolase 1 type 2
MQVRELVDRLLQDMGVSFRPDTVDTLKEGSLEDAVRGVTVTFLATQRVLERARELGDNVVITHEPTYYNHLDETSFLEGDPVFEKKRELIRNAGLTVFRIHDTIHTARPDGIHQGMLERLDWLRYQEDPSSNRLRVPGLSARALALEAKQKLGLESVRLVGNAEACCRTVECMWGACGFRGHLAALANPDVQALVVGEAQEWETYEYARDAGAQGRDKALIVLGHAPSEEAGMRTVVRLLERAHPGLPVHFVEAGPSFMVV